MELMTPILLAGCQLFRACWAARLTACALPAGPDILEGCPPGQVDAARQMLQKQGIEIVYNAMVSCITWMRRLCLPPSEINIDRALACIPAWSLDVLKS